MNTSSHRTYILGVCLLLASALALQAQNTGSIKGIVTDVTTKAIPRAVVSIRNEAGGALKIIYTDEDGRFSLDAVAEGSYTIEASAPSFAPSRRTGVRVSTSQSAEITMSLNVNELSQSITVEGSVELAAETALLRTRSKLIPRTPKSAQRTFRTSPHRWPITRSCSTTHPAHLA